MSGNPVKAAIIDYGLGNLFSVKQACEHVGMESIITSAKQEICTADVVLLPGVGAYADAMKSLHRLDLVSLLRDIAAQNRPFVGICLGLQLMMTQSHEFGLHDGLNVIEGDVVRFKSPSSKIGVGAHETSRKLKVPQVGWNCICPPSDAAWEKTPLQGVPTGMYMYFVHSYYAVPVSPDVVLSTSNYGGIEFCSSLRRGNLFACQFHPERSGPMGLQIYRNIASLTRQYQSK